MKFVKLIAAGLLAATTMSSAFAAYLGTVHVTGSSAFRASTLTSIRNLFEQTGAGQVKYGYAGSSFTGATFAVFYGELAGPSTDTITITTNFTGSAAGIQAIVQTTTNGVVGAPANVITIPYLESTDGTAANTTGGVALTIGGLASMPTPTVNATSDIAISDVQTALTAFRRPTDKNTTEATGGPVGIIPFYWVANNGSSTLLANITSQQAKGVLAGGLPLTFWSDAADPDVTVYAVGRNADSGTRITAFQESDYGAFSSPQQYRPLPTVGTGQITSLELYPAESVLGIPFGDGESGFNSGGTLNAQFGRTIDPAIDSIIVGYLGRSDAIAAVNAGARLLSYNGVLAPLNVTGVPKTEAEMNAPFVSGQYTFWSYEHVYRPNGSSGTVTTITNNLANNMRTVTASLSGIPNGDMNVSRGGEGETVTP